VRHYFLISTNVLILFGIRKNCLKNGSSQPSYVSIRRVKTWVVLMREALSAVYKYYTTYSVEVKSLCKRSFWGLSTWIWNNVSNTSHVVCIYRILGKSGSFMGQYMIYFCTSWDPWAHFSGRFCLECYWDWFTHETISGNENVFIPLTLNDL
jgi:hypothetical protein